MCNAQEGNRDREGKERPASILPKVRSNTTFVEYIRKAERGSVSARGRKPLPSLICSLHFRTTRVTLAGNCKQPRGGGKAPAWALLLRKGNHLHLALINTYLPGLIESEQLSSNTGSKGRLRRARNSTRGKIKGAEREDWKIYLSFFISLVQVNQCGWSSYKEAAIWPPSSVWHRPVISL